MRKSINISAFTLVEFIVVVTILAILATIGYISLLGYGVTTRDTTRISNLQNIQKAVELYSLEEGVFPPVTDSINVTYSGTTLWKQGSFGDETHRFAQRLSEIPLDPLTFTTFAYSRTIATGEYQVGTIVEQTSSISQAPIWISTQSYAVDINPIISFATTKINGNYNGKFISYREEVSPTETKMYIFGVPTILTREITDVDLQTIYTNNSFVYEGGPAAPATFSGVVEDQGNWIFDPTNTTPDDYIIYEGDIREINSGTGKLDFIQKLQEYYKDTDIEGSYDYNELEDIDAINKPNPAIELVNTYIRNGLIDIEMTEITETTESFNSWWDCVFGDHAFGDGCFFGG